MLTLYSLFHMRDYLFSIAILVSWLKRVRSKPCIPISGKLGIIIGQDYQSILNYTSHFRSEHKNPFGLMGYTTLSGNDGELTGLIDPVDYGSGIEWVDGLRREFPRSSMNLGLYLVDQLDSVLEGRLDSSLDRFVEYIKQHSSCTDFYVRVGYEFDNPSNHYSPHLYIKAFQYIVLRFRAATVRNALFVWHSMGEATKEDDFAAWFPGTNYVDICGVSIFQQPYRSLARDGYKMPTLDSFAKYCQNYKIPLMIAESTPFGGMVTREQERKNASVVNRAGFRGNTWDHWFRPVISFIHSYDVRIWSYINCNWDTLPMWQLNHAPGIYWGDSRIEQSKEITNLWLENVLHSNSSLLSYGAGCYEHNQMSFSTHWKWTAIIIFTGILSFLLYWGISSKIVRCIKNNASFLQSQQPYELIP